MATQRAMVRGQGRWFLSAPSWAPRIWVVISAVRGENGLPLKFIYLQLSFWSGGTSRCIFPEAASTCRRTYVGQVRVWAHGPQASTVLKRPVQARPAPQIIPATPDHQMPATSHCLVSSEGKGPCPPRLAQRQAQAGLSKCPVNCQKTLNRIAGGTSAQQVDASWQNQTGSNPRDATYLLCVLGVCFLL